MLSADCIDTNTASTPVPLPGWRAWLGIGVRKLAHDLIAATEALAVWQERAQMRRALARLDERMLSDIGLARIELCREIDKPFWRP